MSRKPDPKAAQNAQLIKNLLRLEPNKLCADCKKNKHPRWASWNLGVFVCIRCSGIHRGMGTHISKVKSVDLDAWTDEQLHSIVSWGNARAKKYWEAKLPIEHVPSESKIENFIRTKYELKQWVMDGPMPDPATLDDEKPISADDEVGNLGQVAASTRKTVGPRVKPLLAGTSPGRLGIEPAPPRPLIGLTPGLTTARQALAADHGPLRSAVQFKDSLLGLDLFGDTATVPPPRPASAAAISTLSAQSRPDLKQSILSLYASAPKPPSQAAPNVQAPGSSLFKSMPSPTLGYAPQSSHASIDDAFSHLAMSGGSARQQSEQSVDPFASFGSAPLSARSGSQSHLGGVQGGLGSGNFFDAKPSQTSSPRASQEPKPFSSFNLDGLDILSNNSSATSPQPVPAGSSQQSNFGGLFDLSTPAAVSVSVAAPVLTPASISSKPSSSLTTGSASVFNISAIQSLMPLQSVSPPFTSPDNPRSVTSFPSMNTSNLSSSDVWGSNAWASPDPISPAVQKAVSPKASQPSAAMADPSWGTTAGHTSSLSQGQNTSYGSLSGPSPVPNVSADEEFGGWTSGTSPVKATESSTKPAPAFASTSEDLFSNVWQ